MKSSFTAIAMLITVSAVSFAEDESKQALNLPLEMQQLMQTREREIADIETKFEAAVRKLRAEFRQKGDTRSVLQLDAYMAKKNDPIIGEWMFAGHGSPGRLFRFNRDGSWSRPAGEDYGDMKGRWARDGDVVIVWREDPENRYPADASKPLAELRAVDNSSEITWIPLQGKIRLNGKRPSTPAKAEPPRAGSTTLGQDVPFFR